MIKLHVGESYSFKVEGTIQLPNGSAKYKISDPNGVKHLLDHRIYNAYGFDIGSNIICRVDKINCSGKIFLEPKHPYYSIGESYEFVFVKTETIQNTLGTQEQIATFKDQFKNITKIPLADLAGFPRKEQKYNFTVRRIKQGQLFISVPGSQNDYSNMKKGDIYSFVLSHLKTYAGKYEYYVLRNKAGKEFLLRSKFYRKYNLKIGDTVNCSFREVNHQSFIEPLNPYYEIGKEYIFNIIGNTKIHIYPDGIKDAFLIENKYGKEIILEKDKLQIPKDKKIKCRVTDIINSQVFITC